MTEPSNVTCSPIGGSDADGNTISPLPGEPGIPNVAARRRISMSRKGLLAVGLLIGSLVAVVGVLDPALHGQRQEDRRAGEPSCVRDRPTAATAEPRRLEMPAAPAASAAAVASAAHPGPGADGRGGCRADRRAPHRPGCPRSGWPPRWPRRRMPPSCWCPPARVPSPPWQGCPPDRADAAAAPAEAGQQVEPADPNDPIATTTRNLQGYQRQLQGLLDTLTRSTAAGDRPGHRHRCRRGPSSAGPRWRAPHPAGCPLPGAGLFGGQLRGIGHRRASRRRRSATAASRCPRARPSPAR